ncbi:hypothetical protein CWI37_0018p0040 [Hamiltosporidium tvaerminnensis]|uniref:Uncharacterized protein n=1 Tax=Hamiltosporidium tvaerminnensis TaxID=1176355 RepID=A0A4Q9LC49_9MICR|nr:hypothetical protein CWI37_0018p0040 [Hamiltosporidium tvaerminnensis]
MLNVRLVIHNDRVCIYGYEGREGDICICVGVLYTVVGIVIGSVVVTVDMEVSVCVILYLFFSVNVSRKDLSSGDIGRLEGVSIRGKYKGSGDIGILEGVSIRGRDKGFKY